MTMTTGTAPTRGPAGGGATAYAQLSRQIKDLGLLRRRSTYYSVKTPLTVLAVAGGWLGVALLGDSWWTLILAVFLGIGYVQIAFIGHDAGHRQVMRSSRGNYLLGVALGNLGIGMSYGWWVDKHNRHHAHPNVIDRDPDIPVGALVHTREQAALRSTAGRLLSRLQVYLFVPMLLLEGLHLHVVGVRALLGRTRRARGSRSLEIGLFTLHLLGYVGLLVLVLTPWQAVVFGAVHQGVFGLYMGCSFAPNHKGMRILTAEEDLDYVRRQVLTSRNIRGGRLVDFALGGLNYQVEHHLFPSMPRPNLRRSQQHVRQFCLAHGIDYCETGLWESYARVFRHLHAAGRPLETLD